MIKQKYQVFNSKIADVGISETPSPLESANVGILDPPPPLKTADVLYGRLGNAACRPPRSALPIEFLVLSQSFLFRPQCISLFIGYLIDAAASSGILKAKQKLGRTFNFDKLGGIAFTKISKLTMCSA